MSLNVWDSLASVLFHSVDYTVDFNVFQYMDLIVWTSVYGPQCMDSIVPHSLDFKRSVLALVCSKVRR